MRHCGKANEITEPDSFRKQGCGFGAHVLIRFPVVLIGSLNRKVEMFVYLKNPSVSDRCTEASYTRLVIP